MNENSLIEIVSYLSTSKSMAFEGTVPEQSPWLLGYRTDWTVSPILFITLLEAD